MIKPQIKLHVLCNKASISTKILKKKIKDELHDLQTEEVEEPIEEDEDEKKEEAAKDEEKDEDEEGKVEEEKDEDKPKTKKVSKTVWDWELMNSVKPIWTRKWVELTIFNIF